MFIIECFFVILWANFAKYFRLGGTGRIHNWNISREIVEKLKIPVFLAGGLNVENVVEAIEKVRPFGVDLCSGVRSGGASDKGELLRFMEAIW